MKKSGHYTFILKLHYIKTIENRRMLECALNYPLFVAPKRVLNFTLTYNQFVYSLKNLK